MMTDDWTNKQNINDTDVDDDKDNEEKEEADSEQDSEEEENYDLANQGVRNRTTRLHIFWLVACSDREFVYDIIPTPGITIYYYILFKIIKNY